MTYKKIEQNKNKYKYEVEIDYKDFEEERARVVVELGKNVKISGFRPGKAPKDAVEKEVGYKAYLEAINRILPKAALEVIEKENLNPISAFKYDLKDLDKDKNISFTFEFVTQPEINLADFTKISVAYKEPELGKDEADMVIKNIIKSSLPKEKWEKNIIQKPEGEKEEVHVHEEHDHSHEGHDHAHDHQHDEDITITDDLIEAVGYEDEKTYQGLKTRVEETLNRIKREEADNQFATQIIQEALKISDFEIPEDFVEKESAHKEEHFNERLKDLKLNQDMYLKTQGTTLEELRKSWREEAERNIRTDLLLINLGVAENLIPTEEEVEAQIEKFEDPKLKASYKSEDRRNYLKTALTRDKALRKLVDTVKNK